MYPTPEITPDPRFLQVPYNWPAHTAGVIISSIIYGGVAVGIIGMTVGLVVYVINGKWRVTRNFFIVAVVFVAIYFLIQLISDLVPVQLYH